MSHILTAKTAIINPNTELLRGALDLVISQYGGTIETYYKEFSGKKVTCNTGLAIHIGG